ncbi:MULTISPECIES: vWA domain-containing protein [Pseudonocardia]|uniref:VWA domain containing CoxE-like protein n=2 Tax=Pseudonocardia TaxID=1847 RepID=A0A1Y2N3M4_PSEAH|nr:MULTISPECIES: VWA domain-containing protein [Pseudonocardia]OSY42075.1 VWA domain containing CoxE-like protein [Pseudonocardia autotrophica]TDN75156.1 hypothetical protein C8E95_4300 [Pseudonocardia autotrophica]BBF99101.1 hypothetical protein Pdca_03110 [Pseudonocardia autotrophica]GEC24021.1 hypothetical protein PSA01_10500 [Pseudonocardia saturnea]
MAEPEQPDVATLAARLGAACRAAGLPVGPDRAARFAAALAELAPVTAERFRDCARATLVADPADLAVLDRVLAGAGDQPDVPGRDPAAQDAAGRPDGSGPSRSGPAGASGRRTVRTGRQAPAPVSATVAMTASPAERLAERPFDELTPEELAGLAAAMAAFRLVTPSRRSRRTRPHRRGREIDLQATLRVARRTGGDPARPVRRARQLRPRRLVVLCDVSGSMEPWTRMLLQLLWCARAGSRAEVFAFATRLTRLTAALGRGTPAVALDRAARAVRDRSGGTRIGDALASFLDGPGARGTARGAVVLVVSDGWETGDPERLGRQMARLSRLAHRIVWCNPRTRVPGYRPLAGGMAAAWPYCDEIVSAHSLDALGELLAALAAPRPARRGR